jgi:hypothetical protein
MGWEMGMGMGNGAFFFNHRERGHGVPQPLTVFAVRARITTAQGAHGAVGRMLLRECDDVVTR